VLTVIATNGVLIFFLVVDKVAETHGQRLGDEWAKTQVLEG